jgi:hypothetical protein
MDAGVGSTSDFSTTESRPIKIAQDVANKSLKRLKKDLKVKK